MGELSQAKHSPDLHIGMTIFVYSVRVDNRLAFKALSHTSRTNRTIINIQQMSNVARSAVRFVALIRPIQLKLKLKLDKK